MADKLTEDRIQTLLAEIPEWKRAEDTITRSYMLPSFAAALLFASTVGHLAEAANHHPDILIQWKKVTLILTTHDAQGLSEKDFDLARRVDALPFKS